MTVSIGGGDGLEQAWPLLSEPRDACAGDELRVLPGSWEGHHAYTVGPRLPQDQWEALDARFQELFPAVLCGRADPDQLRQVAATMGLAPGLRHDRRPAMAAPRRVDDGLLADVGENNLPDLGLYAAERVLGPFAELPLSFPTRRAVGATLAFTRLLPQGLRAIDRFYREKPRPDVDDRAAVKCIERSPPMLWSVHGDTLRPLLPLGDGFRLDGPVQGLPPGPAVLGRLVPTADGGRWLACALPLPLVPDPAPIMRRMTWEMWRMRRHELRLTWEDLLRERGEVLTRTCYEWCWEQAAGPVARGRGWRWPDW